MATADPQTADCVFCAIVRGDAPATFLHQDELVVAFMDIRPVQPGRPALETIADQIRHGSSEFVAPDASGH
jgi:hypothetical protein